LVDHESRRPTGHAGAASFAYPAPSTDSRSYLLPTYHNGRHEYGQNFLNDKTIQMALIDRVKATTGPIIEIGGGAGALTDQLAQLERSLTVVEIDYKLARLLEHQHRSGVH